MSVADSFSDVDPGTQPDAEGAGVVVADTDGGCLSTSKGPNGPAAVQLPNLSHTVVAVVMAVAVDVPGGTAVDSENIAWAGLARPARASEAWHSTETSWLVH